MTYLQAVIMGIFQGFSEFLPISSSGHLALLENYFGIKEGNMFFTEMLHFGTLLSIFIVYRHEIWRMIVEFLKLLRDLIVRKPDLKINKWQKLALMILVGTIPTMIIGLGFNDMIEKVFQNILYVGIGFIITGFLLWFSEKHKKANEDKIGRNVKNMNATDALVIGTLQGIAIMPGISRSGSTIVGALYRGLDKKLATDFSFFMSIPPIFGAWLISMVKIAKGTSVAAINGPLILGVLCSAVVGVITIQFLVQLIKKSKLHYFSFYLWALGLFVIATTLIKG